MVKSLSLGGDSINKTMKKMVRRKKKYAAPQTDALLVWLGSQLTQELIDFSKEGEPAAKKHDFDADEFDFEENGGVGEWSSDWSSEWKSAEE